MIFNESALNELAFNELPIEPVATTTDALDVAFVIHLTVRDALDVNFKIKMPTYHQDALNVDFIIQMPAEPSSVVLETHKPETPKFGNY